MSKSTKILLSIIQILLILTYAKSKHQKFNNRLRSTSSVSVNSRTHFDSAFLLRNGSTDPAVNKRNAEIARYIVHEFDWLTLASISIRDDVLGSPFGAVKIYSDGTKDKSTGIPYMYLSDDDYSFQDLEQDNRTMVSISMDQRGYCRERKWDAQDPRCHWLSISGKLRKLQPDSSEHATGYRYLLDRHPDMTDWTSDKVYHVVTVDIFDVNVEAGRGELECVPMDLYYKTEPKNHD